MALWFLLFLRFHSGQAVYAAAIVLGTCTILRGRTPFLTLLERTCYARFAGADAAMIAEYLMGTAGIGFLFSETRADFNMERAFGATVVAIVVSIVFFVSALAVERWVKERWN